MSRAALQPMPVRGLRAGDAARYIGMSESKFREMISTSRLPAGFAVDGIRLWDIRDLDEAFERLKGGGGIDGTWGDHVP